MAGRQSLAFKTPMPLYEYRCEHCGHTFEVIQKVSDPPAEHCPSCGGGPVHKLLSSPAIQFKGTGWYITDYARKGQTASGKSDAGSTTGGTSGETKTETKPDAAKAAPAAGDGGKKE